MKTVFLEVNGIRHRVCVWGSRARPLLFFIHGWMDTGASFHFLCDHLKKDFFCVAPDLRGFGKSAHAPNPLGYFFYEYLADVHALLNHFSPKSPVRLIGHSMGGNIASSYAGTFPERVSFLVNIEGFGIQDMAAATGPKRVRSWIESDPKRAFKVYPSMTSLAARIARENPFLTAQQSRFLAQQMGENVGGGCRIAADPRHKNPHPYLFQLRNAYPFWRAIEARVLNVVAKNTEMKGWLKSKSLMTEIKKRLGHYPKGSKTALIPDCGHMVHLQKPHELALLIKDFVWAMKGNKKGTLSCEKVP